MKALPSDYAERVYAGVLGKTVGVYLGRPFEQWSKEAILSTFGPIWNYVHEQRGVQLVVADDDLSGTFTFIRALEDTGCRPDFTPEDVANCWLNYTIEDKTIFWWGGMGTSTEHTAYLRLKAGVPAPASGSIELNGKTVAEQIGSQIFIDAFPMVCPNEPELAADFARRSASVSHDGEALYGAMNLAAMEAAAFSVSDIDTLLDTGLAHIPSDCVIATMAREIRAKHQEEPDWEKAFAWLDERYGYAKFGGGCHMVPNHGLILLALLYGAGDFQKSLMIVNSCGWDTDCNSGNLGCLLGIRGGLAVFEEGPDWLTPFADRLLLPTADGGNTVTDCTTQARRVIDVARRLRGESPLPESPTFSFPWRYSVQGFAPVDEPDSKGRAKASCPGGELLVDVTDVATGWPARVATPTFLDPRTKHKGYGMFASPRVVAGQRIVAQVDRSELPAQAEVLLFAGYAKTDGAVARAYAPAGELEWTVPSLEGPIFELGFEVRSEQRASGRLKVRSLDIQGTPSLTLVADEQNEHARRGWLSSLSTFWHGHRYTLIQNTGRGMASIGTFDWRGYAVETTIQANLAASYGLAACVRGQRRYVALELVRPGKVRLVRWWDSPTVLAEQEFAWELGQEHRFRLEVGTSLKALVDGHVLFELEALPAGLESGAVALLCEEGRVFAGDVEIRPL